MERAVIAKIASAVDMDIEQLLYGGGIKAAIAQAFDSQAIAEDKIKAVGSGNKAVKVLEMYELKENGRLATIGIKDGKYQHVYVEGIDKCKWSYDDVMFLGEVAQEIKRLVEPSKAQRG